MLTRKVTWKLAIKFTSTDLKVGWQVEEDVEADLAIDLIADFEAALLVHLAPLKLIC